MPSYMDYKYGVEHLFISLLAKSKFRTEVKCMYNVLNLASSGLQRSWLILLLRLVPYMY